MKVERQPLRRRDGDPFGMNLPDGKTCADCAHCHRCCSKYGHIPADEQCDWSPSRFTPAPVTPQEGQQP